MNLKHFSKHSRHLKFYTFFIAFLLGGFYLQAGGLSGKYTINPSLSASATNYTSFNDAASDLLTGSRVSGPASGPGVSGKVLFQVADGSYNEQVEFSAISGASATNTVTFTSASADSSLVILYDGSSHTSAATNYTLHITGASYLIFDRITIQSTSTGSYSTALKIDALSSFNTISHCQLLGVPTTSTFADMAVVNSGNSYDQIIDNMFNSNSVRGGSYGFFFQSNPTTQSGFSVGNSFVKNVIDSVYFTGIAIYSGDSSIFDDNKITVHGNSAGFGIDYNNQYGFFGTLYSTGQFNRNTIIMPDGGTGIYLNYITGGSSYSDTVSNNFISVGGASQYGVYAFFCDYINFYYNSILIYGINSSAASTPSDLEVANFNGVINACDVYNNNLVNLRTGTSYTIFGWSNSSKSIKNEDYNNLYSPNSQFLINYYYTNYKNMAAWKANTYGLAVSDTSVDPYFVSTSDLHVSNLGLNGTGTPISGITTDIDGQTRNATTPDIGADEFRPILYDAGIISIDSPAVGFCAGSHDVYAKLINFGTGTITSATIDWSVNGSAMTSVSWTGSLTSGSTTSVKLGSVSFASGTTYKIDVSSSKPNSVLDSNAFNDARSANVTPGLIGTFLISNSGGTPDYTSINAAASDLANKGVCGAVTMNIEDGTYNEHVSVYAIGGASNTKRVTFQSKALDSTKVTIDTSYNFTGTPTATVSFIGASYVTFKKLTVTAGTTTGFDFYKNIFMVSGGSCFDSISNNVLIGLSSTYNYNANAVYSPGDVDSFLTVSHNSIKYGSYGVMLIGVQGTSFFNGTESGDVVAFNTFDSVSQGGVSMQNVLAPSIHDNTMTNLLYSTFGGTFAGTYLYACSGGSSRVYNNKFDLPNGGSGIDVEYSSGTPTDSLYIYNNFISIEGTSSPMYSSGTFGLNLYQSNYLLAAFNSVNVTNSSTAVALQATYYGTPNISLYDNNLVNTGGGYAVSFVNSAPATSDYNNYYVPKSNVLGSYLGTDEPALADWQTASSLDANSISITPIFKSTTNLHAQNTGLQAGLPLNIHTDIDGQSRASVPMIGADEFVPVANDAGVLSIDSPSVPFCVGTKDVYVRLINFGTNAISSVTINYSVNGAAYSSKSITISPALAVKADMLVKITSVAFTLGKTTNISAYTSSPNGTTDGNVNNDSNSTAFTPAISGTYVIDPAGAGFTSFHSAVAALQAGGVCGPVLFNVVDGSYNESVTIGPIAGTSSKNTVTFQSKSLDSTKVYLDTTGSGSSSTSLNATITLSGCKWITFQKMTISHSSGGNYCPVVCMTNGASHNYFNNNIVTGQGGSGYSYMTSGFYFSPNPNNYNVMDNNIIKNAAEGLFIDLYNNYSMRNTISNCWIDSCYGYGIKSWFTDSFVAYRNVITNLASSNSIGIDLYFDNYGVEVTKNKIDLPNGGTGIHANFSNVNGIYTAPLDIANNFVSVGGSNQSIGIFSQYDNGLTCYNNNVNMYNTDSTSYAGYFLSVSTIKISTDVQNNVFYDSVGYAIYTDGPGYPSGDFNDLYSYSGNVGFYAGTVCKTLADWQTNSGMDASSVSCNPLYTSDVDLHVKGSCISNSGTNLGVLDDIDGQTRSTTTPDIGADEFTNGNDIGASAIVSPLTGSCGTSSTIVGVKVHNYGSSSVSGYTVTVIASGGATGSATVTPAKALGTTDDTVYVSFSPGLNTTAAAGPVKFKAYATVSGDVDHSNDTTKSSISFLKDAKAKFTAVSAICAGKAINITDNSKVDSSATVNYKYYLVIASTGKVVDSATGASPSLSFNQGGNYRIRQSVSYKGAGCGDTFSSPIFLYAMPQVSVTYSPVCLGDTSYFYDSTTAGSGTISSYKWTFGNGDSSAVRSPKEVYTKTGTFTVSLTVTNSNGCSNLFSKAFKIDSVNARFNYTLAKDGTASFTASDNTLKSYVWDFGDKTGTGSGSTTSHKYAKGGYQVMLTTTNSAGCSNSTTDSVNYVPSGIEIINNAMSAKVFPNPFNSNLYISYDLNADQHVKMEITDVLGRTIATLTDKTQTAGSYTISVNPDESESMSKAGIYFLKMMAGDETSTYKLIKTK